MLSLNNITKKYKDKVIFQNADFEAATGEIVLLMGQSGIGKSTFLDIIAGIKSFDSGRYYYQNQEIFPYCIQEAIYCRTFNRRVQCTGKHHFAFIL
jgi:ABC-type sugar transport system ATPase subunit